jgi:hypothetical protein
MLCFAPVILAGYLFTLHPNHSHVTSLNDPLLEAQTCERGPGLDAKVTASGMGSLQAQYGLAHTDGDWTFILTPKAGGAILPSHVRELTSPVNFSLGLQTTIGYQHARVALEYWHQSNASLGHRNAGLDMVAVMGGWAF